MHSPKATPVTTKRRGQRLQLWLVSHHALGQKEGRGHGLRSEPRRRQGGAGSAGGLFKKVGSGGAVRAAVATAVTATAQPALVTDAGHGSGRTDPAPLSPPPAPFPREPGGARAQSVAVVRVSVSARGPGGGRAATHRLAGRAGRGGPGAQVSAAAECGAPRRPQGPSSGRGRVPERRAGQEAGSPAASERPHAPGDLRRSALPPGDAAATPSGRGFGRRALGLPRRRCHTVRG